MLKRLKWAKKQYQIYALVDPRDNAIRYVGLSDDVKVRMYQHTRSYPGNVEEQRWIEELRRDGLSPILQVLETIDTGDDRYALAREREEYWITEMSRLGYPLLNVFGVSRPYKGKRPVRKGSVGYSSGADASPTVPFALFRIDIAKLSRPELSTLSGVSVSSIKRAEDGLKVDRLTESRILGGLSQHLGREVKREEIDEFKD
ncbi:MAG: GIY-YIG nuclease family protein [Ktedonobacteraceae bacterium]